MKKIFPVFFVSIVLLAIGIWLSLLWGMKGGGYLPAQARLDAHVGASLAADFDYFWSDVLRRFGSGIGLVLLQLLAIFPAAFLFGAFARRIGQPSVIGHIFAGIVLGPSIMGRFFPDASQFLWGQDPSMVLHILGSLGVILFMFLAGMEMDFKLLRNQTNSVIMVSHIGIFLPFFLGVQAASWIYRDYGAGSHFISFSLMMGIGMSITAFPVLVKILQETNLIKSQLGQLALSSAAVDDVTAWLLLSVIIAVISASSVLAVVWTLIFLGIFLGLMLFGVRPLLKSWHERFSPSDHFAASVLLLLMFVSATVTEVIGIHTIFGAFVAGTLVPKNTRLCEHLTEKLEYFCSIFLLPIFFVISGLRTHFEAIRLHDIPVTLILLLIAVAGKWGGAWAAGRITGMPNRDASVIGALMNTRGLMELIVLNIAYELGIFSSKVFSMMVIMALVTTAMTGPIIQFYKRRDPALGN